MVGRGAPAAALVACLFACVLLMASVGLALVVGDPAPTLAGFSARAPQIVGAFGLLGAPVLGAVLASSVDGFAYARWWCLLGLGFATSWFAEAYLFYVVAIDRSLATAPAATIGDLGWVVAVLSIPFLLLHFPDGAPPSRRWRMFEVVLYAAATASVVGLLLLPGEASVAPVDRAVVSSSVPRVGQVLLMGGVALLLLGTLPAIASLIVRYRQSSERERSQIRWVVYAAVLLGLSLLLLTWWEAPGLWDSVLEMLPLVGLYVAVGIAVLHHRVVDVDLLINRSLVYGVLSAGLLVGYVGLVWLLSWLFDTWGGLPITVVGTAVVCVAFQPLRERLQRSVNRLLYGERDDPFAVISRLARTLQAAVPTEEVLPTVVETTARALRLPHASIWVTEQDTLRLVASYGPRPRHNAVLQPPAMQRILASDEPTALDAIEDRGALGSDLEPAGVTLLYPLKYRGSPVGVLCLAPRQPAEGWSRQDLTTLADLARQTGAAVHAVRLSEDLQHSLAALHASREQLVSSQELERRRIQRDLHDGLGPILAAIRLHLDGCLQAGGDVPAHARKALERVDQLVGQASADVRALVSGLHPPQLAQLGLASALQAHVEQFGHDVGISTRVEIDPQLTAPPAVEVSVFRIVQEALTNVATHSRATSVVVTLASDGQTIRLSVRDNGRGMPTAINGAGTGLTSMRERAALLGGTLNIRNCGDGAELALVIPTETSA
jgi:signal transduction histidine kinase